MIDPNTDNEFHVYNVDGTPDADLPLRVLRACVSNCEWLYHVHQDATQEQREHALELNQRQNRRREIFLKAIAVLETGGRGE